MDFERAEKWSQNYEQKDFASADDGSEPVTIDARTTKVRALALSRQKGSSWVQKTRWALHDQKKMKRVIEDLDENVKELEDLFPLSYLLDDVKLRMNVVSWFGLISRKVHRRRKKWFRCFVKPQPMLTRSSRQPSREQLWLRVAILSKR